MSAGVEQKAARPHGELIRELLDSRMPKSEREHAAAREIEALRAEVEDYRENGASAVRFAHTSAHWSAELRRLFGDDARGGIEVLEQRHRDSLARAERLAEALRDAADDIDAGVSPADVAAHLRARADLLRDQEAGRG